jgi:hypothetical protein
VCTAARDLYINVESNFEFISAVTFLLPLTNDILRENHKYVTPHKTGCKTIWKVVCGCKKKELLSYFGRHFRETGFGDPGQSPLN